MALRQCRFLGGSAVSSTLRPAATWLAGATPRRHLSSTEPERATSRRRQRTRVARNAPTCGTASVGSDLVGTPKGRLRDVFAQLGLSSQLAEKVAVDVHRHGAQSLDDLSVSPDNKALLHEHGFHVSTGRVVTRQARTCRSPHGVERVLDAHFFATQDSSDGTVKWLIDVGDGLTAETVFIPVEGSETSRSRGTLCVSSQAGCSLSCKFCFTGVRHVVAMAGFRALWWFLSNTLLPCCTDDAVDQEPVSSPNRAAAPDREAGTWVLPACQRWRQRPRFKRKIVAS